MNVSVLLKGLPEWLGAGYPVEYAIKKAREENHSHLFQMIGLQEERVGELTTRFETDVTPFIHNSHGVVHGGVIAYIADCAMGLLVRRFLPPNRFSVTADLKIQYIGAVREGKLMTQVSLLHFGKRTAVAECKMYNGDGGLVAACTASFAILKRKQ